jgi:hypothetical protein
MDWIQLAEVTFFKWFFEHGNKSHDSIKTGNSFTSSVLYFLNSNS